MSGETEVAPTKPRSNRSVMLSDAVQIAQLLTLVIGLIVVSANMGAKNEKLASHDKSLDTLTGIVTDLTKSQISTSKDVERMRNDIVKLEELDARVRTVENDIASNRKR